MSNTATRRDIRRSAVEYQLASRERDDALEFIFDYELSDEHLAPYMVEDTEEAPCIIGLAKKFGFTGACSACRGCSLQPDLK